jgi:predicted DNA-binding transcriptional regulator YafY
LEDGGIEIQMKLIPTLELERWLLGWGRHATVLEPMDLAEAVRKHAREMLSNYEPSMEPRRVTECMSTDRIFLTA